MQPRELLEAMFGAAVDAALPSLCVPANLPPRPKGRTIIIGAGKASGAMAKAVVPVDRFRAKFGELAGTAIAARIGELAEEFLSSETQPEREKKVGTR